MKWTAIYIGAVVAGIIGGLLFAQGIVASFNGIASITVEIVRPKPTDVIRAPAGGWSI